MRGRDGNGRFTAGNSGGPGRPTRRKEEEYLAALTDAVTIADWKKIVTKARDDAMEGDHQARQWLSRLLIGDGQPDETDINDDAELALRRIDLIESYLRPVAGIADHYPPEELARVTAERLMQVDGARIADLLKPTDDAAKSEDTRRTKSKRRTARDAR